MSIVDGIREAAHSVINLKIESEPAKVSTYFGLAVLVVVAVSSFQIKLSVSGDPNFLYDNRIRLDYVIVLLFYFLCDMWVSYHYTGS